MRKFLVLLFIYLGISLTLIAEDIRFMSWNVENCFDTKKDSKSDKPVSIPDYQNKIALISQIITKINPTIAGLCEVENINVLKDIAAKSGFDYYYLIEGNDPRGIDVALMSKIELSYYKSNKNHPTPYKGNPKYKFSRDCTEALLKISNKNIYILTTHLKSGYNDDGNSEIKRIAQVNGILDIINNIYQKEKEEPYIIVNGDFNSERNSHPLNILESAGLIILNYLENNQNNFYTYIYKSKKKDLDYIVINEKMNKDIKNKKIQTYNDNYVKKISDHFPVIFDFKL